MTSFEKLEAKQAKVKKVTEAVEVVYGGELVSLEFTELDGDVWAGITSRHPARPDSVIDAGFSYNYTAASIEAAPLACVMISGTDRIELSEGQAEKVIASLKGHYVELVVNAVWGLNEWAPTQRVLQLKKASRAAALKKRLSPEN